jgi:hypothetical protein
MRANPRVEPMRLLLRRLQRAREQETFVALCLDRRWWIEEQAHEILQALERRSQLPFTFITYLTGYWTLRLRSPIVDPVKDRSHYGNLLLREKPLGTTAHFHWVIIGRPHAKMIPSRYHDWSPGNIQGWGPGGST